MHVQCTLTKDSLTQIAWIPSDTAKIGNSIELGGHGTNDFWLVLEVGKHERTDEDVKNQEDRNHKGNFASIK